MKPYRYLFLLIIALALASCHKDSEPITTAPKIAESTLDIHPTEVAFSWTVDYPGKLASVVELSENEAMGDATRYGSEEMTDNKSFSVTVPNLQENTVYYYRYLVWNAFGSFEKEVKQFTTTTVQLPKVATKTATGISENSMVLQGNISDNGDSQIKECGFYYGLTPDVVANGTKVKATTVNTDAYTYNLSSLEENAVYYVCAYATNDKGTGYGDEITVILHPIGAINGRFSISSQKRVYFSQGNLQYRASDRKWRFAEHQYDCIGQANNNISSSYNGWIDLFGWGTSGYHNPSDVNNTNYQPYSSSTSTVNQTYNYCGYGPSTNMSNPNLGASDYDWGVHNEIAEGEGLDWWTLNKDEWEYVLNSRNASTVNSVGNARYAKATVAGKMGLILFPDQYTHPSGAALPVGINDEGNAGALGNSYTVDEWIQMEVKGAVFLPAAGSRSSTTTGNVGATGSYWSATNNGSHYAYCATFHQDYLYPSYNFGNREYGISVRLVRYSDNQ